MTKSAKPNKLPRVRWMNVRKAFCLKCQRAYPSKTECCPHCRATLVPKIERVAVEDK